MPRRQSAGSRSPTASVDASLSEAFEDARSEIDFKSPTRIATNNSMEDAIEWAPRDLFDDDLQLPPLETFLCGFSDLGRNHDPDCASLEEEFHENDLLPSTPLSEGQLRHADMTLQQELDKSGTNMQR